MSKTDQEIELPIELCSFEPDKAKMQASNGHLITKQLFYEQTNLDKNYVQYTLKEQEHRGYPSLYQLYLLCSDPTEYTFASKYLLGWRHWQKIAASYWFKDDVAVWREELAIKLQSEALAEIKLKALNKNDKGQFQAAKLLLDRGWETKKRTITRTAKDKIEEEATRIADEKMDLEADFERMTNPERNMVN